MDFKKAFDTINRNALFCKLLMYNIKGPFLDILRNMYSEVLFSVKLQNGITDTFSSTIGVKQGCILSPTLFSIYMNDIVDIFDLPCDPADLNGTRLSCLMYADDLVLISNSANGLQACLNKLNAYCKKWDLSVNIQKTKVMIFNKSGRVLKRYNFVYEEKSIELTSEYKYLGIIFKPSGSFKEAANQLSKKAIKAMFCIRKCLSPDKLYVQPMLKLFDTCIKPILLYCSEVWAPELLFKNNKTLESKYNDFIPDKIHLKFCKLLTGVNRAAVNLAVLSELGRYPLALAALKGCIKYWYHAVNAPEESLLRSAYTYSLSQSKGFCNNIKLLLNQLGFEHVWRNQSTFSQRKLTNAVYSKLKDNYISFWKTKLHKDDDNSIGKLRTYRTIKSAYKIESFLIYNFDKSATQTFMKIRISNSKLFIEEGRFQKIPVNERICKLCNNGIEDEVHFITNCISLESIRANLFLMLSDIVPSFIHLSNEEKFNFIMMSKDYDINKICVEEIHKMYLLRNELAKTI